MTMTASDSWDAPVIADNCARRAAGNGGMLSLIDCTHSALGASGTKSGSKKYL